MSLRATEPKPPSGGINFDEPARPRVVLYLAAAVVVVAAIVAVGIGAATGHINVPFVGKPTVNYVDTFYHWTLTFPKAWATKKAPVSVDTIRYESDGAGVGVRVQAQFLKGIINADTTKSPAMLSQLKGLEGPTPSRPDATIVSGPEFGTITGAPFVHYVVTYTDFSSGVPVGLEDSDYFVFNGANLEIITFECDAKNFRKESPAFLKAFQSFHSKYLTLGDLPPASPTPSPVPSPSPAAPPAASPGATPSHPAVTGTAKP